MDLKSEIEKLFNEGLKKAHIAKQLGCNRSTVTYYLNKKYKNRAYHLNRRYEIKKKAVEYKGGCCSKCGYNKCLAALDFHHIDPSTKEIHQITKQSKNFESIKEELDKCILLCSNCHRELHYELTLSQFAE